MNKMLCRAVALAVALILMLAPAVPALAAKAPVIKWAPSKFADAELNRQTFLTMKTEYPVYKTGVSELFVELISHTKRPLLYGQAFYLERKNGDKWEYCYAEPGTTDDGGSIVIDAFTSDGYVITEKGTDSMAANPSKWGLTLPAGQYRIIKTVGYDDTRPYTPHPFSAEFTVAENGYDPAASPGGYTPLGELPKAYGEALARLEGVFYIKGGKAYNADRLFAFLEKAKKGLPAKLRLADYSDAAAPTITDITFRRYSPYLVETDATRAGRAEIDKQYYANFAIHKRGGKTRLLLANTLQKQLVATGALVLLEDIAPVGKSKLSAAVKMVPAGDGDANLHYIVYCPANGTGYARYSFEEKSLYWYGGGQTGGSLSADEIKPPKADIKAFIGITWLDEARVCFQFALKGGGLLEVTVDTVKNERVS